MIRLRHLGGSGLLVAWPDAALAVDPPTPVDLPTVITWTERERVAGARGGGPVAAAPEVLRWLGVTGVSLGEAVVPFAGLRVVSRPYPPIPYATPPEAVRKTLSALRSPVRAAGRLAFLATRPPSAPRVVRVDHPAGRVVLLGQALHRFLPASALGALAAWAGRAALVVAGTDYDDEVATGTMLGAFDARARVIADLTGPVRRALDLPVRPLAVALAAAPPGTLTLEAGGAVETADDPRG